MNRQTTTYDQESWKSQTGILLQRQGLVLPPPFRQHLKINLDSSIQLLLVSRRPAGHAAALYHMRHTVTCCVLHRSAHYTNAIITTFTCSTIPSPAFCASSRNAPAAPVCLVSNDLLVICIPMSGVCKAAAQDHGCIGQVHDAVGRQRLQHLPQ